MKKISCFLLFLFFFCFTMCLKSSEYVTPEMFGARGDGIYNDAIAFNKCIKSGKTIKLKRGRTYNFSTPLSSIIHEIFRIDGNGAKIIISKKYPVTAAMAIFVFSMDINPKLMEVKNISFECLLEEKKIENAGDTYFFLSKKCDKVIFKDVTFKSIGKYNNLTFFRSEGGDLLMDGCEILLNTYSRVGGVFWLMNKSHIDSKVLISNSSFEYESNDECMCFATAKDCKLSRSNIKATITNCKFKSLGTMRSSGFIIVYSRCLNTLSDINVTFRKCQFESSGVYPRYIQTYQCGDEAFDFGCFLTIFENCTFNFSKKDINDYSEGGLVGLVYDNANKIKKDHVGYDFKNCIFNLNNIYPIVGDRDASRKGYYRFSDCKVTSNLRAFQKKYNVNNNNITLVLNRCDIKSSDEILSYKQIDVNSCNFYNEDGKIRHINKINGKDLTSVIIGK